MGKLISRILGLVSNTSESNQAVGNAVSNKSGCMDFNITGCDITIQGKLLLVIDAMNETLQKYFSCFCNVTLARLQNTNLTPEILSGTDTDTGLTNGLTNATHNHLRGKLKNMSAEFSHKKNETGIVVILSDRGFTSKSLADLDIPYNKEPFLFFVNVGPKENTSESCFRQHRFITNKKDLIDIGQEMESIACTGGQKYREENCLPLNTTITKNSSNTNSLSGHLAATSMIAGIVSAFVLVAVLCILFLAFRQQKKRQKLERNAQTGKIAQDNEIDCYSLAGSIESRRSSTQHDMYNKLWEKEREDIKDNYHHIDTSFAKENMENSLYYDVVGGKVS